MSELLVKAEGIYKRFGKARVLNNLSISLSEGEIVHLQGKNGSGKTTLLRVLSGLSRQDTGSLNIEIHPVGYVSHTSLLYSRLSVLENFKYFTKLLKPSNSELDNLVQQFELSNFLNSDFQDLSHGQRQLVGIALSFISDSTRIFFYDEVTAALDKEVRDFALGIIKEEFKRRNAACIYVSHGNDGFNEITTRSISLEGGHIS